MRHPAMHLNAKLRDVGKSDGVIRFGVNRFTEIAAHFGRVDIKGGGELDVANVVTAELNMHQAGNELIGIRFAVKLNTLDEG